MRGAYLNARLTEDTDKEEDNPRIGLRVLILWLSHDDFQYSLTSP